METETVKTEMPKEIHAIEYAGFWDFNTDGFYGPSLLNIEDNKDAEQVANEIARRYNSHYELLEACKKLMSYIDNGMLVRNTANDAEDGWAIKMLPFVQDLKAAQEAIAKATS